MIPVELWDLELGSGILWEHMHDAGLAEAIDRLASGHARTRSNTPLPAEVRDLEALWLAGGRAMEIDRASLAQAIGRPVFLASTFSTPSTSSPPVTPATLSMVAERGAQALFPKARALVVLDLGQSHLKLFTPHAHLTVPRPWDRLPLRDQDSRSHDQARGSLLAWVTEALGQVTADPDVVVVALPCELGDTPIPGGSSYAGLEGDPTFVPELIESAGWRPRQLWVLNDAELAAAAARLDPRIRHTLTLVLTLGFGVGGALLRP